MYIFGVYLSADSDIDCYIYEVNIVESLYNYYNEYGYVVIVGDINSSLISLLYINVFKYDIFFGFVNCCNIVIFIVYFKIFGEIFFFLLKCIMLDYILFNKCLIDKFVMYKIFIEGLFFITLDYLFVFVELDFKCIYYYLVRFNL